MVVAMFGRGLASSLNLRGWAPVANTSASKIVAPAVFMAHRTPPYSSKARRYAVLALLSLSNMRTKPGMRTQFS